MNKEVRLCLHVALYAECRRFYEDVLGWPIYNEWDRSPMDKGVIYRIKETLLELLYAKPKDATKYDGSFYLYIETPDLKSLRERLKTAGHSPSKITSYSWGHTSFTVKDPAGFMLKFFVKFSDLAK